MKSKLWPTVKELKALRAARIPWRRIGELYGWGTTSILNHAKKIAPELFIATPTGTEQP